MSEKKERIYLSHDDVERAVEKIMIAGLRATDVAERHIAVQFGTFNSRGDKPFDLRGGSDFSKPLATLARHIVQAIAEETGFDVKIRANFNDDIVKAARQHDDAVLIEACSQ